jgi:plastocyanin
MRSSVIAAIVGLLLVWVPAAGTAQTTHLVKLHADTAEGDYRFEPAVVVVHVNDVLVFKVVNGGPHNVTFEAAGLSPQAHAALNASLPGRSADLTSPLLTAIDAEYRMVVPAIPTGRYRFFCLPHRAYDEVGELRVE